MDESRSLAEQPSSLSWWTSLFGICVLAVVLRLVGIDRHSFWYDEAVTARFSNVPLRDLAVGTVRDNGNPPLYWMVIGVWADLFGRSEPALRSFSVICSCLTVPILVLLGRRLLGSGIGLLAGFLLAVSPMAIELGNEARVYAMLGLLVTLNLWLFVRWLSDGGAVTGSLYLLTLGLCFYSHYYALGLPVVHGLGLAAHPRGRCRLFPWLAAVGCAGLLFVPWAVVLTEQLRTPDNLVRMGGRWITQFLATPTVFSVGRSLAWRDATLPLHVLAALVTLAGFLLPACWGLWHLRHRRWPGALLGAWWLGPILGPLTVAILAAPLYATRYAYLALPAFVLAVAYGIACCSSRVRTVALTLIITGTAFSLTRYVSLPLKDDWRAASDTILATARPGASVLFDTDIEVVPFLYYANQRQCPTGRLIGITAEATESAPLTGVVYRDGKKVSSVPVDCTSTVTAADEVWLALCVPQRPAGFYKQVLAQQGYHLTGRTSHHRIELLRFTRTGSEPVEGVANRTDGNESATSDYKNGSADN